MSRALIPTIIMLTLLAGCALPYSSAPAREEAPPVDSVNDWLAAREDLAQLSAAEVQARLAEIGTPDTDTQHYYYALLKMQSATLEGWTQARSSFATLLQSPQLQPGQQRLVALLQDINQDRINNYFKLRDVKEERRQLEDALATAQEEKLLLEQKIQALTDLETAISTRREE